MILIEAQVVVLERKKYNDEACGEIETRRPGHLGSQVTFSKKLYESLEALQADLDIWLEYYNTERTHQDKMCSGRTPMETLIDGKSALQEKLLN